MIEMVEATAQFMASRFGLEARPQEEWKNMKPGYYMDLNANLAVVNEIEAVFDKKRGHGIKLDADVLPVDSDLQNTANHMGVVFWEYLGEL